MFTADAVTVFFFCRSKRRAMTNPTCPEAGQPMFRDVQPMTITYKGREATFDMPGW